MIMQYDKCKIDVCAERGSQRMGPLIFCRLIFSPQLY